MRPLELAMGRSPAIHCRPARQSTPTCPEDAQCWIPNRAGHPSASSSSTNRSLPATHISRVQVIITLNDARRQASMTNVESLIETTIVATFGREKTMHDYLVTVVGNDAAGYRVQVRTVCGRVFDETTKTTEGAVSCPVCEIGNGTRPMPPCAEHSPAGRRRGDA